VSFSLHLIYRKYNPSLLAFWGFLSIRIPSADCDIFLSSSHASHYLQTTVMPLPWSGWPDTSYSTPAKSQWMILLFSTLWLALVSAMTPARIAELRAETVEMFYHGFDNYMNVAFPEDEVRLLPGG